MNPTFLILPPLTAALALASCGGGREPLSVPDPASAPPYEVPAELDRRYEAARAELERAFVEEGPLAAVRWLGPDLDDARSLAVEAHETGHRLAIDFAPIAPIGGGYLARLHVDALAPSSEPLPPTSIEVEPRWVWVDASGDGPWTIYADPPAEVDERARVTRVAAVVAIEPETRSAVVDAALRIEDPGERVIAFDFVHDLDVMAAIEVVSQHGTPLRHTHVRDKLVVELDEVAPAVEVRFRYRLTPLSEDGDAEAIVSRGPWIPRRAGSEPAWHVERVPPEDLD